MAQPTYNSAVLVIQEAENGTFFVTGWKFQDQSPPPLSLNTRTSLDRDWETVVGWLCH